MTDNEIEALKRALLSPKQATSAAGSITERDSKDLAEAVKLLKNLDDERNKKPLLNRLGIYGRSYE